MTNKSMPRLKPRLVEMRSDLKPWVEQSEEPHTHTLIIKWKGIIQQNLHCVIRELLLLRIHNQVQCYH